MTLKLKSSATQSGVDLDRRILGHWQRRLKINQEQGNKDQEIVCREMVAFSKKRVNDNYEEVNK
jgi:hypothetical protein